MKFNHLISFSDAVKYGSISIAAKENYISQSAFSSNITKLEESLGATLLVRTNQGVKPTKIGEKVFYITQDILMLLDEIRLAATQSENFIDLHLASMSSMLNTLFVDVMIEFEKENVLLILDALTGDTADIVNSVQTGVSDIGIVFSSTEFHYPGLDYNFLFKDRYVLFVGEKHPAYNATDMCLQEALHYKHVVYNSEYVKEDNCLSQLTRTIGTPKISLRVDSTEAMLRIIARSEYVAFFPEYVARHDAYVESGKIHSIPINDTEMAIFIGCVTCAKYGSNANVERFMKKLKMVVENKY